MLILAQLIAKCQDISPQGAGTLLYTLRPRNIAYTCCQYSIVIMEYLVRYENRLVRGLSHPAECVSPCPQWHQASHSLSIDTATLTHNRSDDCVEQAFTCQLGFAMLMGQSPLWNLHVDSAGHDITTFIFPGSFKLGQLSSDLDATHLSMHVPFSFVFLPLRFECLTRPTRRPAEQQEPVRPGGRLQKRKRKQQQ